MDWVLEIRHPILSSFFDLVTLLGYPTFLILFMCFGYVFFSSKLFTRVAMLLFISGLANSFLKDWAQDARPALAYMLDPRTGTSYGWPSGHAQVAVTLWGMLALELRHKSMTIFALLLIVAISFSRLYLGVHDLGDVVSGLMIGAGILALWQIAVRMDLGRLLGSANLLGLILISHIIYWFVYPAHGDQVAPVWFMGLMSGWFLGQAYLTQSVTLNGAIFQRLFIASLATGIAFVGLVTTTRLDKKLQLAPGWDEFASYGLGIGFALGVTWFVPWILAQLNLARVGIIDQHDDVMNYQTDKEIPS
jgi:glycerophosphoryl diester phosphodiesterase